MSKAEDRYLEHFQDGRLRNCSSKEAFLLGYHQAEKDFELTVDDIKGIDRLLNQCVDYSNPYQEVLKRFKTKKNVEQEV